MSKEIILSLLDKHDKLQKQINQVEDKLSHLETEQEGLNGDRDNLEEAITSLMKMEKPSYHIDPCFFDTSNLRKLLTEETSDV